MSFYYLNENLETEDNYDPAKFYEFTDNFNSLTSYFFHKILDLPKKGEFTVTVEEYRPDLISYKLYGDVKYWFIILIYNNIRLTTDVVNGLKMSYPDEDKIEDLFFTLKTRSII